MALPLSIFVITLNEAARIGATLDAAATLADDVIVADSGSTDETVAIARGYGAQVHHHPFEGFGQQKRFAEDRCRHDWLLNVDADEIITPALADEIRGLFADGEPTPALYEIRILNVYPGDTRPRPFANDYRVVRLYHREAGRYRDHTVYDRVEPHGAPAIHRLSAPIHHFPLTDFEQMVAKANRHSGHEIARVAAKSRTVLKLRLVTEFPLVFLKVWLLRRHILGGWKGFVFAMNTAWMRTLRIAKALEYKSSAADDQDGRTRSKKSR